MSDSSGAARSLAGLRCRTFGPSRTSITADPCAVRGLGLDALVHEVGRRRVDAVAGHQPHMANFVTRRGGDGSRSSARHTPCSVRANRRVRRRETKTVMRAAQAPNRNSAM
jgi:hypothetical protein